MPQGERRVVFQPVHADLCESLTDIRRRVGSPAVLAEEISGEIPMQPVRFLTAVLQLDGTVYIASVDRLDTRAPVRQTCFRSESRSPHPEC